MRMLALLFGLLGVAGSGYLGMKWMGEDKGLGEKLEVFKSLNKFIQDDDAGKGPRTVNTAYALVGGAAAGLIGVVVMLMGNGKLAALMFLIGLGVSVAMFKDPKIIIFTFGLGVAAACAFVARPKMAPSRERQADAAR